MASKNIGARRVVVDLRVSQEAADKDLSLRLTKLRAHSHTDDKAIPDVLVIWDAIRKITHRNQNCEERGIAPYPMPVWVNQYLLDAADKIGRLWLGIRPDDDRPPETIGMDKVGALRKVLHKKGGDERFDDERVHHVAAAMGFARDRPNAFQRHDREERDRAYLAITADPDHRALGFAIIRKNEAINSDEAVNNRLSKARLRNRKPGSSSN